MRALATGGGGVGAAFGACSASDGDLGVHEGLFVVCLRVRRGLRLRGRGGGG